jgi:hypothetical protein
VLVGWLEDRHVEPGPGATQLRGNCDASAAASHDQDLVMTGRQIAAVVVGDRGALHRSLLPGPLSLLIGAHDAAEILGVEVLGGDPQELRSTTRVVCLGARTRCANVTELPTATEFSVVRD